MKAPLACRCNAQRFCQDPDLESRSGTLGTCRGRRLCTSSHGCDGPPPSSLLYLCRKLTQPAVSARARDGASQAGLVPCYAHHAPVAVWQPGRSAEAAACCIDRTYIKCRPSGVRKLDRRRPEQIASYGRSRQRTVVYARCDYHCFIDHDIATHRYCC